MKLDFDYIVVGSGATGAIAAYSLVESGENIALLDVGVEDEKYHNLIPNKDFVTIRKEDAFQNKYFLGNEFEGIPWQTSKVGSQLTPPRNYLTQLAEKFIPFESETFKPMESMAKGGLGGGWGLGCYTFSKLELGDVGLNYNEMQEAYEHVAEHIGISGTKDDASPYCLGNLKNIQPVTKLEQNLGGVYDSYKNQKEKLNNKGIYVGQTGLALLTQPKEGREALSYNDMHFWTDNDKSAYRSWITIEQLTKRPNFIYHKNCLVMKFEEFDNGVKVIVKRIDTNLEQIFICKKLILSPGVMGTARIVLRSFEFSKEKLPIICNPYCYIPCIQWRMLGKEIEQFKVGMGQLMLFIDENKNNFDVGMASLYSYRTLLLFKLIKETPLNYADSLILMRYLQSSFTIAGIHHPERGSASKFIKMNKDSNTYTGDILTGEYILTDNELQTNYIREKKIKSALKILGCQPLKTVHTPLGGSIHYAGTLPFNQNGEKFSIFPNGKLASTKNVFVADGSGFKYLPAKGLTFSLMANAYNVAKNALKNE